jgi:hypothetical protein
LGSSCWRRLARPPTRLRHCFRAATDRSSKEGRPSACRAGPTAHGSMREPRRTDVDYCLGPHTPGGSSGLRSRLCTPSVAFAVTAAARLLLFPPEGGVQTTRQASLDASDRSVAPPTGLSTLRFDPGRSPPKPAPGSYPDRTFPPAGDDELILDHPPNKHLQLWAHAGTDYEEVSASRRSAPPPLLLASRSSTLDLRSCRSSACERVGMIVGDARISAEAVLWWPRIDAGHADRPGDRAARQGRTMSACAGLVF